MTRPTLSIDAFRAAVQRLPGGVHAVGRYEDWRYTSLEPAIDISERWIEQGAKRLHRDNLETSIERITSSIEANWIVIANGKIDISKLSAAAGIDVEFSEKPQPHSKQNRPLAELEAAFDNENLHLTIHAATEDPVGLLFIDDAVSAASVSHASINIGVAAGCDAEIVEYHNSEGDGDSYANSRIALQIGEAATTRYVRIQDRQVGHVQTGHLGIDMGRDSQLDFASFDLGGGLIRNDLDVELAKKGANATIGGLYLAGDGQHIDNHIRVDHRIGPATSSQDYRGILNGRCRCVWNGKAIVHEGADGTDANQTNHNLLLSDNAEIDAKPELEIYAEDVKCSHGTTVGQLDDAALFYLRTRGLDEYHAARILTHAFAADVVRRTPVNACRDVVSSLVESRLAKLIPDDSK